MFVMIGWCNIYWFVNIYVDFCLVFNVIEWIVSDFYKNKSVYVCILFDIYVVWFNKLIVIYFNYYLGYLMICDWDIYVCYWFGSNGIIYVYF